MRTQWLSCSSMAGPPVYLVFVVLEKNKCGAIGGTTENVMCVKLQFLAHEHEPTTFQPLPILRSVSQAHYILSSPTSYITKLQRICMRVRASPQFGSRRPNMPVRDRETSYGGSAASTHSECLISVALLHSSDVCCVIHEQHKSSILPRRM